MSARAFQAQSQGGASDAAVLKVCRSEWKNSEVKKLRLMWELGFTSGQIAEALNRSRNSICSAARRYQLPERQSPIPHKPKPDLLRQRQEELARFAAIEELMRVA